MASPAATAASASCCSCTRPCCFPLDYLRGALEQHPLDTEAGQRLDAVIDHNEKLGRTETMIALQLAVGLGQGNDDAVRRARSGHDAQAAKPSLARAHEYARAAVPRRVFAVDPTDPTQLLYDRVTRLPVARLRRPYDTGHVTLYPVCPRRCSLESARSSHEALSDFGVGIALYYKNLIIMALLCACLFLVHLPAFYCNFTLNHFNVFDPKETLKPPEFCGFDLATVVSMSSSSSSLNTKKSANTTSAFNSGWKSLSSDSIAAALLSFDYGGGERSNLLVTPLQFIVAIVSCMTLLLAVVFSNAMESQEVEKADARLYSARDYTVQVEGPDLPCLNLRPTH